MKLNVKPGQKLCCNCNAILTKKVEANETITIQSLSENEFEEPAVTAHQALDTSYEALGCSPIKLVSIRDRKGYGKRKMKDIHCAAKAKVSKILNVPFIELSESEVHNDCENCQEWDKLKTLLKEKCATATRREKIRILTIAPDSWSSREIAEEFSVSRYMAFKAKKLGQEKGILSEPAVKKGKQLFDEIIHRVLTFYESDDYSRMCPRKKDFVSVKIDGERIQMQKRLLLVNLKELYLVFKNKTNHKIGFSKFCELRPKWCLPVNSAGMHSVSSKCKIASECHSYPR